MINIDTLNNLFNMVKANKFKLIAFAVTVLSVYLSFTPAFHSISWVGHDYSFHINRAASTINALNAGQFPPLYDVDHVSYPGYSSNLFYPPLSNYLLVSGLYFTNDLNTTIKLVTLLIMVFSTATSYFSLRGLMIGRGMALPLSLCFSCSIYMVDNIFVRAAYPESIAICAIPLFIYGLITESNKNKIILLSISNCIFILSNIPATLCSGIVFIIYAAFYRKGVFIYIYSCVLSVLICSWYVVPLLISMKGASFPVDINWFEAMTRRYITLYDLISGDVIKSGHHTGMALGIGFPMFAAFIYSIIKSGKNESNLVFISFCLIFIICSGMNYLIIPELFSAISKIQFTWRLVPFLLFFMILIISKQGIITFKMAFCILFATSIMNTAISVPKISTRNLTIEGAKLASPKDYVLSGATEKSYNSKLKCNYNSEEIEIPYSMIVKKDGMPEYELHSDVGMRCILPFMAYNSLQVNGVKYERKGSFTIDVSKGDNIFKVEVTKPFKLMTWLSLLLSIVAALSMPLIYRKIT
ncbi:hypothetical protein ACKURH_06130 [Enterobacter soli]